MKFDIENIRKMCGKYITEPKLLIVPNAALKGQVRKALLDENIFSINLHIETIADIALYIVKPEVYARTIIDVNGMEELINDVLLGLKENDELSYFNSIEVTTGLNKLFASTIFEIKMAGFNFNKINFSLVKNSDKKNDLKKIIAAYEDALKINNCLDIADIFSMALKYVDKQVLKFESVYALNSCNFSYLEMELLKKLNCDFLDRDTSHYLDYKSCSKKLDKVKFKRVYGDNLEVKEVIRTIINNKIPFDKVLIVALNSEPYAQLFYQQLLGYLYKETEIKTELPITFGTGLTIAISSPLKLVMTLLNWIKEGYVAHDFINIISSGSVKISEELSRNNIINSIKASGVSWQRKTYISGFNSYFNYMSNKGLEVKEIKWLIELFENVLFPNIPVEDEEGKVLIDDVVIGLKYIMKEICSITSAADKEGYNLIFNELSKLIKGRRVSWDEITEMISKRILELRIFSSAPEAGKMHFTTYQGAEWVKREHTFFIGNDVLRFPSSINQDPILLDFEREDGLVKSKDIAEQNIKGISRFLESVTGNLYLSYSYFDTIQNRENYPSFIFNTLLENMAEKLNMVQYEYEKNNVKTINLSINKEEDFIDENDYILTKACENKIIGRNNIGLVEVANELSNIDITDTKLEFSASALITYLNCNYKYYLKYILGLQGITDRELDKSGWLSYLEIGKIYHEIFEKFENKVIENKELLDDYDKAINEMIKIYSQVLTKYEERLPVASEFKTALEKKAIYDNCMRFVMNEVKCKDKTVPLLTEFRFGENNSCKLLINDEEIYINGIIDRVDLIKESNKVKIIDYKTGSTFGYTELQSKNEQLINEKSIQQLLYYFALKDIAKKVPENSLFNNIALAEYYFVTEKGNYEKIGIDFSTMGEERILQELGEIINHIKAGDFFSGVIGKNLCDYCEYRECCDFKEVNENE